MRALEAGSELGCGQASLQHSIAHMLSIGTHLLSKACPLAVNIRMFLHPCSRIALLLVLAAVSRSLRRLKPQLALLLLSMCLA